MPKLRKYNAEEIFRLVYYPCHYKWSEKRIREYLKKNKKVKVDALWVAKRKDISRMDKIWVLIQEGGMAPTHIRDQVKKFACSLGSSWFAMVVFGGNRSRRLIRLIVKLLEKENA